MFSTESRDSSKALSLLEVDEILVDLENLFAFIESLVTDLVTDLICGERRCTPLAGQIFTKSGYEWDAVGCGCG